MPHIIHSAKLPQGYSIIRFHGESGNYLLVFCLATGRYVGKARHYANTRAAALAARRSAWMVGYNSIVNAA